MPFYGMDPEEHSWKPIVIGAGSSIVLLMLAYFLMSGKSLDFMTGLPEKVFNFSKVNLVGLENGKKVWEMQAENGWSTEENKITYLEHVNNGVTYRQGKPVIKNLHARRVKIYKESKDVEAFGFVEDSGTREGALLLADINLSKVSSESAKQREKDKFAKLQAEYLKYTHADKKALANDIRIDDGKLIISANQMNMDLDKNESVLTGSIEVSRKNIFLVCDRITTYPERDMVIGENNVKAIIKGKKGRTTLSCDRAVFYTADKATIEVSGDVVIIQKNKAARANSGVYYESTKKLDLSGQVGCVIEKANKILKQETVQSIHSPEGQKIIQEKTFLTAEAVSFSTETGDFMASDNVYVSQKTRLAKSNKAEYSEKDNRLELTDNVWMKKPDGWIKSNKIIVSVKDETFEAVGGIETQFKLNR